MPLTILSRKVGGFEIYPSFVLIPFGILPFTRALVSFFKTNRQIKVPMLGFVLTATVVFIVKPFVLIDIIKLLLLVCLYYAIKTLSDRSIIRLKPVFYLSLMTLVVYGVSAYFAFVSGNGSVFAALHKLLAGGKGVPVDYRGGIPRVASLTWEPSYFAFITGISFFVVQSKWMKVLCFVGVLISFSLITVYVCLGLVFYWFVRKFKFNSLFFYVSVIVAQVVFSYVLLEHIPKLFWHTFEGRYGALAATSQFSFIELLLGSLDVNPTYEVYLIHPLSNIGSIFYLYGIWGTLFYTMFFLDLEAKAKNKYAVVSLFLFMFNYYFLTAWPIIVLFIFMMMHPSFLENESKVLVGEQP
ncbi:MAG: hypothetical protein KDD48_08670 [Bdellovibrionales bacterium]|nr:hypothetical protein [Bdellovibrionales bacterium]